MADLTLPTLSWHTPPAFTFGLRSKTETLKSPLNKTVQTIELPGPRWSFNFSYQGLPEADSALLQSFIARMRGRTNRLMLHNIARPIPLGTMRGSPLVNGAHLGGVDVVNVKNLSVGETLLAGDFISINGELKMVMEDVTFVATTASVKIEPPMRRPCTDSAVILWDKPQARFVQTEDKGSWTTSGFLQSDFTISAVEVFG
jgi:hypothetical protein